MKKFNLFLTGKPFPHRQFFLILISGEALFYPLARLRDLRMITCPPQIVNNTLMRFCFFLLFINFFAVLGFSQSKPAGRELRLISLSGNGYQRGLQHGQRLKKEIAELIGRWKKDLEAGMRLPADRFIANFLGATHFIPSIKKYTPDIYEEVRGIAEGSGQSFDDMLAFQLMDEYWVYEDRLIRDTVHHHCSAIGIPARNGKPAFVSQNMDVNTWMDGYQVILHIQKNGVTPEQYILSCAGLVALNGLNEYGIGVCVNTLMQLQASDDGLPVAFMIRGLLEKKDEKETLSFLTKTRHASGQNYTVGIVDSVYDFEASADKVVRMYPLASGIVYHTNHPMVNDEIKPWYQEYYSQFLTGGTKTRNSEIRFAALARRADSSTVKDEGFIKNTLRSKDDPGNPICRSHLPDKTVFTFGSVLFSLSDKRAMQVTAGPPDESTYQSFSFKR